MDCKEIREMYKLMFAEYPDIVTVKDLQAMLSISRHAAYQLCSEKSVRSEARERVGAALILVRAPPRLK